MQRANRLGLALASMATLLLQVSLTRILSVTLWHHFGFLIIGTALLGLGASGVVLLLWPKLLQMKPGRFLPTVALLQAVAVLVSHVGLNALPLEPFRMLDEPAQLLYLPLGVVFAAAPFLAFGLVATFILTRFREDASRLYFSDLIGASVGCVLVAVSMPALGGRGSIVLAALLAATAALSFTRHEGPKRLRLIALGAVILLSIGAVNSAKWLPLRITGTKVMLDGTPVDDVLSDPMRTVFTEWNTFSRIDVVTVGAGGRLIMVDAGTAVNRVPVPTMVARMVRETTVLTNARPGARVMILGSGGGWEVAEAIGAGASSVVAVEVNPILQRLNRELLAPYNGNLFANAAVRAVSDEARSFMERDMGRYDLIISAHTISNAAMASGGLALSESHLLTTEAFSSYLDHLDPGGLLVMTRPSAHMPRLVSTASAAVARRGVPAPEAHLATYTINPFLSAILVGVEPLTERRPALNNLMARVGYSLLPVTPDPVVITDDRPFLMARPLWSLGADDVASVFREGTRARMAVEDRPVAEVTVLFLLLQSLLFGSILLVVPWRRSPPGSGVAPWLTYFVGIGLAYVIVEIGLIHGLTLLVGQPVYALAVVLASLLLGSGMGAHLSERWLGARKKLWMPPVLAAIATAVLGLLAGPIAHAAVSLPLAARLAMAVMVTVPVGMAMGTPFPIALRSLPRDALVPWAWGANGFASVVGSVLAVALGMSFGFRVALLFGAACYGVAALGGRSARQVSSS